MIRNEIHRPLDGIEVAPTIRANDESLGIRSRCLRFRFRGEAPLLAAYACKCIVGNVEDFRVDLDIVSFAVLEQVMMRMNGGGGAVDGDRIEVKSVRESTDDSQLVLVR